MLRVNNSKTSQRILPALFAGEAQHILCGWMEEFKNLLDDVVQHGNVFGVVETKCTNPIPGDAVLISCWLISAIKRQIGVKH